MRRITWQAGLFALLLMPSWDSVHAIDVPSPRLELIPAAQPDAQPPPAPADARKSGEEATREQEPPPHRAPFLFDVMPSDDDRPEPPPPAPDSAPLDVRRA